MKTMKGEIFKHKHVWLLVAVAILIVGHGVFLYYLSSHVAVAVMVSAVIIMAAVKIIAIKHRGSSGHLQLYLNVGFGIDPTSQRCCADLIY